MVVMTTGLVLVTTVVVVMMAVVMAVVMAVAVTEANPGIKKL
jgi:hypothetical protein